MKKRKSAVLRVLSSTVALAALLTAMPAFAQMGDASAQTDDGRTEESKEQHSLLIPYDENGNIVLERNLKKAPTEDFSTIRVLLTTGKVKSIKLNLVGAYYLEQSMTPIVGTEESPAVVTVSSTSSKVSATYGGKQLYSGSVLDINRVSLNASAGCGTLITTGDASNNGRKYLGSFRAKPDTDGNVMLINVIPTAHYLYGIVPYEMSESCNLEALKAQAVTAKTYAFGFTLAKDDYEITDSFNYQGYRGYTPGYTKCMQACLTTRGALLSYNGSIPLAFYGASNGGETALPSQVFGTSPLDSAYQMKTDNIDFKYATSKMKTLEITYGQAISNSGFKSLLEAEAKSKLGYSVTARSVVSASVNTPAFAGSTRNLTKMDVTVKVEDASGNTRNVALNFAVSKLKSYGAVSGSYKIYWGKAVSGGYNVYFCRWGHGLGLSQYGADGYAKEGYDYKQILNFYFTKMKLEAVKESDPELPGSYTKPAIAYGEINSATVRLRSEPNTSSTILDSLPRDTHVTVVGEKNGWLICIANEKLGYIRGDLVSINLFPSSSGATQKLGTAAVKSGAVFKSGPSAYCEEIMPAVAGSTVEIWHTIGAWYHVRYNGRFMYINSSSLGIPTWDNVDLHGKIRITD